MSKIMEKQGYAEPTGQAKITPTYNPPCKFAIRTLGPIAQAIVSGQFLEVQTGKTLFQSMFLRIKTGIITSGARPLFSWELAIAERVQCPNAGAFLRLTITPAFDY